MIKLQLMQKREYLGSKCRLQVVEPNTDQLPEGSSNLYFTVARFVSDVHAGIIAAGFHHQQRKQLAFKLS
jgi:uncharacterized protein with WD repeat